MKSPVPKAKVPSRSTAPLLWALGSAALALVFRIPFVQIPFSPYDEGYYAAVARATASGSRLYADAGYVRPPLLNAAYWLGFRFAQLTGSRYDLSVRVLAALFAAATVGVLAYYLFSEFSMPAALAGSALAILFSASMTLENAANAETWLMLPYTISALLVLHVATRQSRGGRDVWIMLAAGACTGISAGFKEVALVNVALPVMAWVLFRRPYPRSWLKLTLSFLGGTVLAWGVVLAWVAATDDVRAFIYHTWLTRIQYASSSHEHLPVLSILVGRLVGLSAAITVSAVVTLACSCAVLVRRKVSPRAQQIVIFALGWVLLSAMGVAASGRFYPHYFIQATFPLALLLAAALDALTKAAKRTWAVWAIAIGLGTLAVLPPALSMANDVRLAGVWASDAQLGEAVAARVTQLTPASGSYFVWGEWSNVGAYSPRRSTSRIQYAYYPFGPPDGHWALGRFFPSDGAVTLEDLRRQPPDTVLLTSPLGTAYLTGLVGSPFNQHDDPRVEQALLTMLKEHFVTVEQGDRYVVLKRAR